MASYLRNRDLDKQMPIEGPFMDLAFRRALEIGWWIGQGWDLVVAEGVDPLKVVQ